MALRIQARQVRESVRAGLASIEDTHVMQAGSLARKTPVAKLLGVSVPALEARVVSNEVEEPDRSKWFFAEALDALEAVLAELVRACRWR